MTKQRIEPLNDAEQCWVATEVSNARGLVDLLSPDDTGTSLTPDVLDRTFKAAHASAGQNADAANAIINAIGMAFGQYLVEKLGFEWIAVFDKGGSEIAVVALPSQADVLVFPTNLVAKRWTNGTTDFFGDVYRGIEDNLQKLKSNLALRKGNIQMSQETGTAQKPSLFRRLFRRGAGH